MGTGVGVTIGSHSLRAMAVRRKGPLWQVTAATAGGLEGSDDAARAAEARSVLAGAGMKGDALVGLTGKDLIVRYTHVPRVPDWRLDMLMRFEIQEVAEQSGGDVAADWALLSLPAAAGGDQTVLVALSRNSHLVPRLEALRAGGLKPLGGCPRSIGLYHAFVTNAKVPPGEVTLLLHLGGENTDVAIQRDGALLFARNLAGGGKPFTEALVGAFHVGPETAEKMKVQKGNVTPRQRARYADSSEEKVANALLGVAGTVVSAVHSSLMFCKAQTKLADLRIDRVLVSGGASRLRGLCEYLSSALGIPVEPFDPFETVDLSALPAETAEAVRSDGPGMAAVLGLAQMAADRKAFRLEILPEADRKRRNFAEHTAWLLASGAVAAAGLVFLYRSAGAEEAAAVKNERDIKAKVAWAESQRERGEKAKQKVALAAKRLSLLQRQVSLGPSLQRALDLVQGLIDSKPEYNAIHFPKVSARFDRLPLPPKILQQMGIEVPADAAPPEEEVPLVEFEGSIKPIESTPDKVYSRFSEELMALAEEKLKLVVLQPRGGLQKGKEVATFKMAFSFFDSVGR